MMPDRSMQANIQDWLRSCDFAFETHLPSTQPLVPASAQKRKSGAEEDQDLLRYRKRQRTGPRMSSTGRSTKESHDVIDDEQSETQETPRPERIARQLTQTTSADEGGDNVHLSRLQQTRKRDHTSVFTPPQTFSVSGPQELSPTRSSISEYTNTSRTSKRSRNSAKRLTDLRFAAKPTNTIQMNKLDDIPEQVKELYSQLIDISDGIRIIPSLLKDRIKHNLQPLRSWMLDSRNVDDARVMQEFSEIQDIHAAALECAARGCSEAAWNDEVHSRILRLALSQVPGVEHNNVTSATICSDFLAQDTRSNIMGARMVDYTINIVPSGRAAEAVTRLITEQPASIQTINQTLYSGIQFHPSTVSIETKTMESIGSAGHLQLAVWSAAHFSRLEKLLRSGQPKNLPPHLNMLAHGHPWKIQLAQDLGTEIRIVHADDLNIGETSSLFGLYKLRATLQCLGRWSTDVYWEWFKLHILDMDDAVL